MRAPDARHKLADKARLAGRLFASKHHHRHFGQVVGDLRAARAQRTLEARCAVSGKAAARRAPGSRAGCWAPAARRQTDLCRPRTHCSSQCERFCLGPRSCATLVCLCAERARAHGGSNSFFILCSWNTPTQRNLMRKIKQCLFMRQCTQST